jgi:hypothetical protein
MSPLSPLYFLFTHSADILHCRMATYDRQKIEAACIDLLHEGKWCKIAPFQSTFYTGTRVWVTLEFADEADFDITDFSVVSVEDQEELIPQGAEWTDDLVIFG